jgi:hypothetical protein
MTFQCNLEIPARILQITIWFRIIHKIPDRKTLYIANESNISLDESSCSYYYEDTGCIEYKERKKQEAEQSLLACHRQSPNIEDHDICHR